MKIQVEKNYVICENAILFCQTEKVKGKHQSCAICKIFDAESCDIR